jgi:hypothetical protein
MRRFLGLAATLTLALVLTLASTASFPWNLPHP